MAIRFSNTVEDFMALSVLNLRTDRDMKRRLAHYRFNGALVAFASGLIVLLVHHSGTVTLFDTIPALFGVFIYALIAPILWKQEIHRDLSRWYKNRNNAAILSEYELTVTPDGLLSRNPYVESKYAWATIERIEATADYTFIFISSTAAFVIPNKRVPEPDLQEFLMALKTHYKPDHTLPQPVPVVRPTIEPERQTVGVASNANAETPPTQTNRWYAG